MKQLLMIFAIVLLAFSVVSSQETTKENVPLGSASGPVNTLSNGRPKADCLPVPSGNYPAVPAEILNISLVKRDGTSLTIGDLRGNVVLLNLWATWAAPARAKTPGLVELQDKYLHAGLTIVGVNIGDGNALKEDALDISKFAETFKVNYDLVEEVSFGTMKDAVYKLTKFAGIPQTLLIDRAGRLRGIFLGGGEKVVKLEKETVEKLMTEK